MSQIISSQRYLDDETVNTKRENKDYEVSVVSIAVDGVDYRLIVDGHHSYAAAIADGIPPVISESDYNYQTEIDNLGIEAWLETKWIDSNFYDIATGQDIW